MQQNRQKLQVTKKYSVHTVHYGATKSTNQKIKMQKRLKKKTKKQTKITNTQYKNYFNVHKIQI